MSPQQFSRSEPEQPTLSSIKVDKPAAMHEAHMDKGSIDRQQRFGLEAKSKESYRKEHARLDHDENRSYWQGLKEDVKQNTRGLNSWKSVKHLSWYCLMAYFFFWAFENYLQPMRFGTTYTGEESHDDVDFWSEKQFKWADITPSEELVYHECFDGRLCARLSVPMDWNNTDPNGERVAVAIVKLPAKVPVTDEKYGGVIVTNPGGPGGSGVGDVIRRGADIQSIVDASGNPGSSTQLMVDSYGQPYKSSESFFEKPLYFDILSFDPRGINNTTPHISCFDSNFERQRWLTSLKTTGYFGSSNVAFNQIYSRGIALSETCTGRNSSLLQHMNTAPVVADIVAMIEAHGRWREKTAKSLLESPEFLKHNKYAEASKSAILARTSYRVGEEKLQYWGFSYGTLLGATFASLQPHRVSRIILDGVVNATDYYAGKWLSNLQDTDQIIYRFGDYCHEAGPERCALWRESPVKVLQSLEGILNSVWDDPVPVPGNEFRGPEIITYEDIIDLIVVAVYKPIKNAARVATFMQDLSERNGTAFADYKSDLAKPDCDNWTGNEDDPDICAPQFDPVISSGILCTDAISQHSMTKDDFADRLGLLRNQSKWLGDMWGEITLPCIGWRTRPKWRFDGEAGGITDHPILLIGNTYDCVTPLRNAITTSAQFPGSVVLTQHSEGHCSAAAPSTCTAKYVRQYFQTGQMPNPNTTCEAEEKMFFKMDDLMAKEKKGDLKDLHEDLAEALMSNPIGMTALMQPDERRLLETLKRNTDNWV